MYFLYCLAGGRYIGIKLFLRFLPNNRYIIEFTIIYYTIVYSLHL